MADGMKDASTLVVGRNPTDAPEFEWRDGFGPQDINALSELADAADKPDVFATPEWLAAVLKHPERRRRGVWTLRRKNDAGAPISLAVLTQCAERLHGVPLRTIRALGDPIADRFVPLTRTPQDWVNFIAALGETPFGWDAAVLSETVLNDADQTAIAQAAEARGWRTSFRTTSECPVIFMETLDGDPGMTRYAKKLRQNIRRGERYLQTLGTLQLEKHRLGPDNVDALLSLMCALEHKSAKRARDKSFFLHDASQALLRRLADAPSPYFETLVYALTLNGKPIAFDFGFASNGRFYAYQGSFDHTYAQGSPGVVLAERTMRDMLDEGYQAMDASRTSMLAATYIARWPHEIRRHSRIYLYRNTLRGRLFHLMETQIRPAAKRVAARVKKPTELKTGSLGRPPKGSAPPAA